MGLLKRVIGVLFFILFTCSLQANDKNLFKELKKTANLQKNETLAVIYQTNGNCIKCYLNPMGKIDKMVRQKLIKEPKKIALVRCDRDLELNIFKKVYEWKDYLYRDDGTGKSRLGVKKESYLTIFDSEGRILYDFDK